ncbi:MAG: putative selenium-dependent hydroxylase accessory protein YqeC [Anaerolineae bacterium]|nr:putative selenium-dependent hydroxylase accessory protein YqeC [Anaerolineae bacterium]
MPKLTLRQAFNLQETNELIAIVGGGGKTSLMFALANSLPGRIVVTTTTRIFAAQMKLAAATVFFTAEGAEDAEFFKRISANLDAFGQCLVIGEVGERQEKAFGIPLTLPRQLLAQPDVDFVLVEADGSRMRPIKAPADHEPVIPPDATLVVPVVGMDALERPLSEIAHRPEKVEELLIVNGELRIVNGMLTSEAIARVLIHPQGGLKNVPDEARVVPLLNKVDSEERLASAREIAQLTLQEPRIERVVLGAMQAVEPVCEVWGRITAVVLAAGESKRMGQSKQLLPWGNTTVLGQVLQNLKAASLHDTVVVSGHDAEAIEAIAHAADLYALRNTHYASGEMISSLQTAVSQLPSNIDAILVVLADQPLVTPAAIDQILTAYRQGKGDIIAPVHDGQRGNPVLISRRFFADLLALPPDSAPRDLLRRQPEAIHFVEMADNSILIDLDDPETYQHWQPT